MYYLIEEMLNSGSESKLPLKKETEVNVASIKLSRIPVQYYERAMVDIKEFCDRLEKEYSNARTHVLFHRLIGSTPPKNCTMMEDFPGEYSIVDFFNRLLKKYKN